METEELVITSMYVYMYMYMYLQLTLLLLMMSCDVYVGTYM